MSFFKNLKNDRLKAQGQSTFAVLENTQKTDKYQHNSAQSLSGSKYGFEILHHCVEGYDFAANTGSDHIISFIRAFFSFHFFLSGPISIQLALNLIEVAVSSFQCIFRQSAQDIQYQEAVLCRQGHF